MNAKGRIGIGIDVADERDLVSLSKNEKALRKTFSEQEIEECAGNAGDREAALARRFAAKEAVMKACRRVEGTPAKIEILHDADGAPFARWEFLSRNGLRAEISTSSVRGLAVAIALVLPAED